MNQVFKSSRRSFDSRGLVLVLLTLFVIVFVFLLKPIAQPQSYHQFADRRGVAGIPNFANVISNLPFVIVGMFGLFQLRKTPVWVFRMIYGVMFAGIVLTGFGSAWYHVAPDNDTLVYDRIPMTIVFMSLLSAVLSELIESRVGAVLLPPLILLGIGSVLWWKYTEARGAGDLRFYGLIQYYPLLLIPALLMLYPSSGYDRGVRSLIWAVAWYVVAKLLEHYDQEIYSFTGFVSGHSLKHLFAAASAGYLVKIFLTKHVRPIYE